MQGDGCWSAHSRSDRPFPGALRALRNRCRSDDNCGIETIRRPEKAGMISARAPIGANFRPGLAAYFYRFFPRLGCRFRAAPACDA